MTKSELITLVEATFGTYGIKTVSATDINKSAYVPNMSQKQIFNSLGINPEDRKILEIKELFTNKILKISYYATLREGAGRPIEVRMGLNDLISYIRKDDEVLFTRDTKNIFIYNLSKLSDLHVDNDMNEEKIYSQINIELLRMSASNINTEAVSVARTIISYPRNNTLRIYVKRRAEYSCEMPSCNYIGFEKNNGQRYIEIHHIIPLSENGKDSIYNTVALCPTCHRKIHHAKNKEELKVQLQEYLNTIEK